MVRHKAVLDRPLSNAHQHKASQQHSKIKKYRDSSANFCVYSVIMP
ncbi:unnamed protein product [Fusarium graminearum]|uniref:Uncharacterized protein n=1 Tax=Gibberella zeae TaxID=5518 RepID=A0A4E9EG93_GIBZA|nr:unnamed protein product [Fusarium graminearum]CAG1985488.1 unnamed protein product [Fusarium graminearum]